jgi:hypothetical protein
MEVNMKKIEAMVIKKDGYSKIYKIGRDLLNEILCDKNYIVRSKDKLDKVIIYDILHKDNNDIKSAIIIWEEI